MLVGLISDSHDNMVMLQKAVDFFNAQKVQLVLHAGDYVAPFALRALGRLSCDWKGVYGNNDGEKQGLKAGSGGRIKSDELKLELNGRKVFVVHDLGRRDSRGEWDVIVHGHTHQAAVEQDGECLLVNPGECCGWVSGKGTVALLDLKEMKASIREL